MEKALESLERKRSDLLGEIKNLGDMRRGSIVEAYGKCGKKNCICMRQVGHPGHGPRYLWSTTIKGKSYSKSLKLGAEMEKIRQEISSYRKFVKLNADYVEVSERICDHRPIATYDNEADQEKLKKKLQRIFKTKFKKKWGK